MHVMVNRKVFEKPSNQIIKVFTDEALTIGDMGYVALNVVLDSYPSSVTDKIQVFCEQFIDKRAMMGYNCDYEQDQLF